MYLCVVFFMFILFRICRVFLDLWDYGFYHYLKKFSRYFNIIFPILSLSPLSHPNDVCYTTEYCPTSRW